MIAGIGIDIVEVERLAEKINKGDSFRDLVFSVNEITYCEAKTNKFEHYAARFAAKEAFFKAIGTGWLKGTSFNQVEVVNDEYGKPSIELLDETSVTIGAMQFSNILVSLTHIKSAASAVVIIEK
ncbi:ACP synthase [Mucilaginibacter sp. PAMC 26640]|nr:ACP synthase [Mucilaginibacter sp. PAMC 26640]